jgi:hypothetical protein
MGRQEDCLSICLLTESALEKYCTTRLYFVTRSVQPVTDTAIRSPIYQCGSDFTHTKKKWFCPKHMQYNSMRIQTWDHENALMNISSTISNAVHSITNGRPNYSFQTRSLWTAWLEGRTLLIPQPLSGTPESVLYWPTHSSSPFRSSKQPISHIFIVIPAPKRRSTFCASQLPPTAAACYITTWAVKWRTVSSCNALPSLRARCITQDRITVLNILIFSPLVTRLHQFSTEQLSCFPKLLQQENISVY